MHDLDQSYDTRFQELNKLVRKLGGGFDDPDGSAVSSRVSSDVNELRQMLQSLRLAFIGLETDLKGLRALAERNGKVEEQAATEEAVANLSAELPIIKRQLQRLDKEITVVQADVQIVKDRQELFQFGGDLEMSPAAPRETRTMTSSGSTPTASSLATSKARAETQMEEAGRLLRNAEGTTKKKAGGKGR
mmetsp:Transcript_60776/g.143597  ORF Transcript_60776/g.143597 Transcript_60776/m.143597 type:complete len:190 (-) Transcript_60776:594-1163(-)